MIKRVEYHGSGVNESEISLINFGLEIEYATKMEFHIYDEGGKLVVNTGFRRIEYWDGKAK